MTTVVSLDLASWKPLLTPDAQRTAVATLEGGGILMLPHLAFRLNPDEGRFLSPRWADGRAKNISFDGIAVKGAAGAPEDLAALGRMIGRFAANAADLVSALLPRYAAHVTRARTSFRPL
ncbi:MAG: 3-deoxy-D-manno-oct-2-ulosonic acid (Kdo) hydroxylase, partial [Betaproteobacteria bacterium]